MIKTALKYGAMAGGIMGLALLVPFFFMDRNAPDFALGEVIGYISMIVAQAVIVLAMIAYRKEHPHEAFHFAKALKLGVLIAAIAATVFVLFDTLYVTLINPDFFEQYSAFSLENMKSAGASQEQIAASMAEMQQYQQEGGILFLEVVMFLTVFLIGFVISLVSALILKRPATASQSTGA